MIRLFFIIEFMQNNIMYQFKFSINVNIFIAKNNCHHNDEKTSINNDKENENLFCNSNTLKLLSKHTHCEKIANSTKTSTFAFKKQSQKKY